MDIDCLVKQFQIANNKHQLGQLPEARGLYEDILKVVPKHVDSNHYLGVCLYQLNELTLAKDRLKVALSLDSVNPSILSHLSLTCSALGETTLAVGYLKKAVTLSPKNVDVLNNLGYLYIVQKDFVRAVAVLEKAHKISPENINVVNNLGLTLLALGDVNSGVSVMDNFSIDFKTNYTFVLNRSKLHIAKHEFREAIELLRPYLATYKSDPQFILTMYQATKEMSEGPDWLKKAYELDRNDPMIVAARASLAWNEYNTELAIELFLAASNLLAVSDHIRTTPPIREVKPYTSVKARETLVEFTKELAANNIPHWLDFGTLLGFIREGNPLEHDKDTDIGVPGYISRLQILDVLAGSARFKLHHKHEGRTEDQLKYSLAVIDTFTGITTDIFFYNSSDGEELVLAGFDQKPSPIMWAFPTMPEPEGLQLQDDFFYVPKDTLCHLEAIYGPGWKIPDKLFDTVVSGKNLTAGSALTSMMYGFQRLMNAIFLGRVEKALNYCYEIQRLDPNISLTNLTSRLTLELKKND